MQLLATKSTGKLLVWGIVLIPLAWVADCLLDAVLFGEGDFWQQLFSPEYHELAIRGLFSIFIFTTTLLGMHFLSQSARKERALLQRNFSLEQLKTEFDGFAGDLARNVRDAAIKVSSNSELLKEQCGQALDEKAHFLTENICLASAQMLSHAGAIIELTETATTEVQRKRVELDLMARRIADSLMTIHNERSLEFSVDADMTAWCDPEMMQQIIYNLFSSAISFIPNNREGVIKFGKLRRDNRVVYYVRDNGNGYGAEQAKVIFNPFRDSKQDPALPEDTIRLAIARRLVIRHGGKIWAEGVPGAGGAVFFTDYPDAIKNA